MRNCAATRIPVESASAPHCRITSLAPPEAAVGVDVGEDFLDLAVLRIKSAVLTHHRLALADLEGDPVRALTSRLRACCPDTSSRWLALIDSPRWPRDLDCSKAGVVVRDPVPAGRGLDRALRAILPRSLGLSMFPTPKLAYFSG